MSVEVNNLRIEQISKAGITHLKAEDVCKVLIQDHQWWVWRVYNAIYGFGALDADEIGNHLTCRLGKWYEENKGVVRDNIRQDFELAHENVHKCAKEIALALEAQNITAVNHLREQMEADSRKVMTYIQQFFS